MRQATVFVRTKPEADNSVSASRTVQQLKALGFDGVLTVKQGKCIVLDLADGTPDSAVREMCEKLLANPVIEEFEFTIADAPEPTQPAPPPPPDTVPAEALPAPKSKKRQKLSVQGELPLADA